MKKLRTLIYALIPVLFITFVIHADAASIYFSPSSGSYAVGQQLRVRVLAESVEREMNAAAAYISFSKEFLELISISQSTSIIDFWAQGPTFSNQSGEASFEGVTFDRYQGSSGELVTLVFRAESPGEAVLRFTSGNILAGDGLGTEIPSSLRQASFSIGVALPTELPAAPFISSPTHLDEGLWYANKNPIFRWPLPSDVTDVDVVVSRDDTPEFGDTSKGLIDRFVLTDMLEGTHYLHVIFRAESGWGNVGTFRFNVDTEPPEQFTIQELYRSENTDQFAEFLFTARDRTSGISHYRIAIDGVHREDWMDDGSHTYRTPPLKRGLHTLTVEAVDKAGNATTKVFSFRISYPLLLLLLVFAIINILLLLLVLVFIYRQHNLTGEMHKVLGGVKGRLQAAKKSFTKTELALLRRIQEALTGIEKKAQEDLGEIKEQPEDDERKT